MKTLHIVRHGKSSWDLPGIADIDRPLLEKGVQNNYQMAEKLKIKFNKPEQILSSPAVRAIHTAIIMARVFGTPLNFIRINKSIYDCQPSAIIEMLEETPAEFDNVMVVGHNPTFTELANLFLPTPIDNLPTTGIVTLQFQVKNWEIINSRPVFTAIDYPKIN